MDVCFNIVCIGNYCFYYDNVFCKFFEKNNTFDFMESRRTFKLTWDFICNQWSSLGNSFECVDLRGSKLPAEIFKEVYEADQKEWSFSNQCKLWPKHGLQYSLMWVKSKHAMLYKWNKDELKTFKTWQTKNT